MMFKEPDIILYLSGKMDPATLIKFKEAMAMDTGLAERVELIKKMKALAFQNENSELKESIISVQQKLEQTGFFNKQ